MSLVTRIETVRLDCPDPEAARAAYDRLFGGGALRLRPEIGAFASEPVVTLVLGCEDPVGAADRLARRGRGSRPRDDGEIDLSDPAARGLRLRLAPFGRAGDPPASAAAGVRGLDHVVVRAAGADRALAFWGARLGLDLRLERSRPEWGARLCFFRCGDAVIEVAAPLEAGADAEDAFGGFAWIADDPIATHDRLAAAGSEVSPVRTGRRPGSHVFTVRDPGLFAPTLVIAKDPDPRNP